MNKLGAQLIRLCKGFGMFWWDFLVGDTPELFVATVVVVGVTAVLGHVWHARVAATVVLPVLVISALVISVRRSLPKK
jgi:hypothetical protein